MSEDVTSLVQKMEDRLAALDLRVADAVEFLREVGPRDPRTAGFIADRVLLRLGYVSNAAWLAVHPEPRQ